MSQPDFLYELFEDFMDDPANQDFSMDNGLVCRWLTGQAKDQSLKYLPTIPNPVQSEKTGRNHSPESASIDV